MAGKPCTSQGITNNKRTPSIPAVLLLEISGDIHPNPGPFSNPSNSLDSTCSSTQSLELLNSGLSIMHLNIQSLRPKLDLLTVESQIYDVLVFTETWLTHEISDDDIRIAQLWTTF